MQDIDKGEGIMRSGDVVRYSQQGVVYYGIILDMGERVKVFSDRLCVKYLPGSCIDTVVSSRAIPDLMDGGSSRTSFKDLAALVEALRN